ncbi:MAG: hypothetical protein IKJ82_07450 [Oscillospiraceae bacterium]|nr:hypothetical protein [Oscillospiraceae bacterium]
MAHPKIASQFAERFFYDFILMIMPLAFIMRAFFMPKSPEALFLKPAGKLKNFTAKTYIFLLICIKKNIY